MKQNLTLLFLIGCVAPDDAGITTQASLVNDPVGFGASPVLTPCWANPMPGNEIFRAVVEQAMRSEYHVKSRLRVPLGAFPPCPEPLPWDDGEPVSVFDNFSNWIALYEAAPGSDMLVDGTRPNAKGSMGGYIVFNTTLTNPAQSAAVHELGHIVGLAHEQNRPGSICREQWEPEHVVEYNQQAIGPYDPTSVMNYCALKTGLLSAGDAFALKALHGSAGSFVDEGGIVRRHHLGAKCTVTGPEQLDAFGGTQLLIDGVLSTDDIASSALVGNCRWPDGFYQSAGDPKVLFALGGEVQAPIGGTRPPANNQASLCWIESPSQLSVYGGDGRVMQVTASHAELGRMRSGGAKTRCPWPDGFYRLGTGTDLFLLKGDTWCTVSGPQEYDFLQVGAQAWTVPVTSSLFAGRSWQPQCSPTTFTVKNEPATGTMAAFMSLAAHPAARMVSGDFNADGRADILLFGVPGLTTVPIAMSNGNGTFTFWNSPDPTFVSHVTQPGTKVVVGKFDADARDDVAIVGVVGWTTIPVFHSTGDGTFTSTNAPAPAFADAATAANVQVVAGDFNGDGQDDIAMTGVVGWTTIPVAISSGSGNFTIYNPSSPLFATTSTEVGARAIAGDFNGDAVDDIALTGVAGWTTIPVAFARPPTPGLPAPTFDIANPAAPAFAKAAAEPGVKIVAGKFNDDDSTDLAAIGPDGWRSIPIAFGLTGSGPGEPFGLENNFLPDFPIYGTAATWFMAGDHDADGDTDLMLAGVAGWTTIPVALRDGP